MANKSTDSHEMGPAPTSEGKSDQEPALEPNPEQQPAELVQPVESAQPASTAPAVVLSGASATDEDLEAQLAYQNLKHRREAKKRKRLIVIVLAVVAALVALTVFVMNRANQAAEGGDDVPGVITSAVYQGDFLTTVTANGATQPLSSTAVTPEVDGIIEGLAVEEGSYVNEGDVLFTLKNEKLDKAVNDANTQVQSAQRTADAANRSVDDAYAAYQQAWDACNEAGDWSAFDEAGLRSAIDSAEASYQDALAAVQSAQEDLREAQDTADKRTVRAPVSGSIVVMNAKNGAAVGSVTGASESVGSGTLMEIADLSQMQVTVQVNEVDIASISEGQQATATFSALPDLELQATVRRIATESTGGSDEGGYSGGVVTYAVNLVIPDPDPRLKPGMTAAVTITTQSVPNTLIVPASALQDVPGEDGTMGTSVMVVDDEETGEAHEVPVEVAAKNSSEAAVSGDLKEGDLVLMAGMTDMGDAYGADEAAYEAMEVEEG